MATTKRSKIKREELHWNQWLTVILWFNFFFFFSYLATERLKQKPMFAFCETPYNKCHNQIIGQLNLEIEISVYDGSSRGFPIFPTFRKHPIFQVPLSVHLPGVEGGRYFWENPRYDRRTYSLGNIGLPKLNNTSVPCHLRPLPSYHLPYGYPASRVPSIFRK